MRGYRGQREGEIAEFMNHTLGRHTLLAKERNTQFLQFH